MIPSGVQVFVALEPTDALTNSRLRQTWRSLRAHRVAEPP